MSTNNTPALPAWLEPAPAVKPRIPMKVAVHYGPPEDVRNRHEYEGLFSSTFDAYDDALERFQTATRIEVKPLQHGGRHGR